MPTICNPDLAILPASCWISCKLHRAMATAAAAAAAAQTNNRKVRWQLISAVLKSSSSRHSDRWGWGRWLTLSPTVTVLLLLWGAICGHLPPAAASNGSSPVLDEITRGFSISLSASSPSHFQPILGDPSANFSFGFLFLRGNQLDLAVVHRPSSFPLWRANAERAQAGPTTTLSFDGRLLLSDTSSGTLYWSPQADGFDADRLVLLNTSNLQIRTRKGDVRWQSFDFPSDTIVQGQNFTSDAQLTGDGFSMCLGPNYLGLYLTTRTMYWKRTALEARAEIVDGKGPIYARINAASGYMAMYQREGAPVDVMPFDSFNRNITAVYLRRLTLESDGNLRGYYWNGTFWVTDYEAIPNMCDLPTACGPYALCKKNGTRGSCGCLHQNHDYSDGGGDDNHNDDGDTTNGERCLPQDKGDLCATTSGASSDFWVLRTTGVDLAYKELIESTNVESSEECETSCERNCSCWGAIYSNASGTCYEMDFPIETLVTGGERKKGYFKVRIKAPGGDGRTAASRAWVAMLVVGLSIFAVVAIFGVYRAWRNRSWWTWQRSRSRTQGSMLTEGLTPVPYSGFRSVELSVQSSLDK